MTSMLAAAVVGAGTAGCRHTQPAPAVAPAVAPAPDAFAEAPEHYCWWSVFRTTLPPDTVAVHFAHAFTTVGLTGATWTRRADTAWAHAGPTMLGGAQAGDFLDGATYSTRVVAFRRGDSTFFRYYVAITPLKTLLARESFFGRHVGFCGEIGRAAAVHGTAPREPNGEEALPVWDRRP